MLLKTDPVPGLILPEKETGGHKNVPLFKKNVGKKYKGVSVPLRVALRDSNNVSLTVTSLRSSPLVCRQVVQMTPGPGCSKHR